MTAKAPKGPIAKKFPFDENDTAALKNYKFDPQALTINLDDEKLDYSQIDQCPRENPATYSISQVGKNTAWWRDTCKSEQAMLFHKRAVWTVEPEDVDSILDIGSQDLRRKEHHLPETRLER